MAGHAVHLLGRSDGLTVRPSPEATRSRTDGARASGDVMRWPACHLGTRQPRDLIVVSMPGGERLGLHLGLVP